jgi:hypothetical protein
MKKNSVFQVPLCYGDKRYEYITCDDSLAKYDAFCEILPEAMNNLYPDFKDYNYCVDLYGMKPLAALQRHGHALTTKNASQPIKTFGREMLPLEANVLHQVAGNRIRFAESDSCNDIPYHEKHLDEHAIEENMLYHYKLSQVTLRQLLNKRNGAMLVPSSENKKHIVAHESSTANSLLLYQLHRVQEELEEYYLKYHELKNSKQAKIL